MMLTMKKYQVVSKKKRDNKRFTTAVISLSENCLI